MSGRTNFVAPERRHPGRIALALWLMAAAGLALFLVGAMKARELHARSDRIDARIVSIRSELSAAEAASQTAPTVEEIRELQGRIERLNRIVGERHMGAGALLSRIELALPPDTWCRSLTYDIESGRLSVSLLSRDEAVLPRALQALEALDILSAVILERQVRLRQGQETLVQYDIRASVR